MLQGSGGDLGIGYIERASGELPLPLQSAPPLGDGSRQRQNAAGKQHRQIRLDPQFELRSSLSRRSQGNPSTELAEAYGAHEQRIKILRGKPSLNLRLWLRPHQLRRNVGIQTGSRSFEIDRAAEGGCAAEERVHFFVREQAAHLRARVNA